MPENPRKMNKLYLVPIINYILNFLNVTPDVDEIKDILNTIGLVAALLMGCVLSLIGAVDKETLKETDAYFAGESCTDDECLKIAAFWKATGFGHSLSYMLGILLFSSCFFSVISLIIVLILILGLASRPDAPEATAQEYHVAWWRSVRYSVIAASVSLVIAITFILSGTYHVILIKYPDYSFAGKDSPLWFSAAAYNWMVILIAALTFLSVGMGQVLAEGTSHTSQVAPEAENSSKEMSNIIPFNNEDSSKEDNTNTAAASAK